MSQIFEVNNIDEAVKLATKFKAEGRYLYFRGQTNASWKLLSTSARKNLSASEFDEYKKSIKRFFDFCEQHPSLNYLLKEKFADHGFAIMQHYGIPTQYIDFTKDPGVACFFASDGKDIPEGQLSCILCLSSYDIEEINLRFEGNRRLDPHLPKNFLIEIDVNNLWRLQAQQGVFLFMPYANIEEYVSFDKIVFSYSGIVKMPLREQIYPVRKSPLELLLDSYFDNERKLVSSKSFKQWFTELAKTNPNVSYCEYDDPLDYMKSNVVLGAVAHSSWTEDDLQKWQAHPTEEWNEVLSDYSFKIDILHLDPPDSFTKLSVQFEEELEKVGLFRKQVVNFHIKDENADMNTELHEYLIKCLKTAWDGTRFLPYTNMEVAVILSNLIMLFINAHHARINSVSDIDARSKKLYKDVLLEDYIEIEMAGLIRADSSRAVVSQQYLASAFREDLINVIVPKYYEKAALYQDNVRSFLQLLPDPKWLFDFNKLKALFVKEIIPTQILLRARGDNWPIFFSPFQLKVLGLP